MEKLKPIGLLQRCLVCFGSKKHLYNPSLNQFFNKVFASLVKQVLRYILQNLGPKSPKVASNNLNLSFEQTQLVSRLQQALAFFGRKSLPCSLRDAMPKALAGHRSHHEPNHG